MSSGLKSAADAQPQVLIAQSLPAVETILYTVPANTSVIVKNASICNQSSSATTVEISIIKAGGSLDATHRVVSGYSLAGNDSLPLRDLLGEHALGPGDAIAAGAGAATEVDFVLSGIVFA